MSAYFLVTAVEGNEISTEKTKKDEFSTLMFSEETDTQTVKYLNVKIMIRKEEAF